MSSSLWFVPAAQASPSKAHGLGKRARAEVLAGCELLDSLGVRFERLVHAPMLGALASADLLAELVDGETVCDPRLAVGPFAALLAELEELAQVALVADGAQLARLAALCVFGREADAARFELSAGSPIRCAGELRPGAMRVTGIRPSPDLAAGQ